MHNIHLLNGLELNSILKIWCAKSNYLSFYITMMEEVTSFVEANMLESSHSNPNFDLSISNELIPCIAASSNYAASLINIEEKRNTTITKKEMILTREKPLEEIHVSRNRQNSTSKKSINNKPPLQPVTLIDRKQKTGQLHNGFQKLSLSSSLMRPRSTSARLMSTGKSPCSSLEDICSLIATKKVKNIIVMAGAGISTASGIPDFRTPGTGLYDNLKEYKIPYPEAIFDMDYFSINPKPFFTLAKELYPSAKYRPNLVHYLCRLLHEKGILLRMYTQNIDGLERLAGIPPEKLVEAHGTFATATCTRCGAMYSAADIKSVLMRSDVPYCRNWRPYCTGVIKPDIVFFGEDLPPKFWNYIRDFPQADLLIVMGTSLEVHPFAGLVNSTRPTVPRLLLNREAVGPFRNHQRANDVVAAGDLPQLVEQAMKILGWSDECQQLIVRRGLELDVVAQKGSDVFASSSIKPPSVVVNRLPRRDTSSANAAFGALGATNAFVAPRSGAVGRSKLLPKLPPVIPNSRRQPPPYYWLQKPPDSDSSSSDESTESSTCSSEDNTD